MTTRNAKLIEKSNAFVKLMTVDECSQVLHNGYYKICELWRVITNQTNNYGVCYFIDDLKHKVQGE